ncbi:MAG: tetratricopeptide repeat protein [Acidobacteriota bacterium]
METWADPQTREALIHASGDSRRLVRVRAAAALAECPANLIPERSRPNVEAALNELEKALRSRPDDWASNFDLGNFYLDRGRLSEARLSFERATRLRPDTLMPWVNLSITCARSGDNLGAGQALRRALQVQPDSPVANFNLALLKAEDGETAEAERLLRQVLKSEPGMHQAAYNLAVLLGERKDYRQAVLWCRRAVALCPEEGRYRETLALYLQRTGLSTPPPTRRQDGPGGVPDGTGRRPGP